MIKAIIFATIATVASAALLPAAPAPFLPRAFAPAPAFAPAFAPAAFAPAPAYHAPAAFAPAPAYHAPAAYRAGSEGAARIVAQDADIAPDGSYHYAYQTENGISGSEAGTPKLLGPQQGGESVQGNFAYTSPEGVPVQINYVADENGFRAEGPSVPQPPPVPAAIQRSIAFNLQNAPRAAAAPQFARF